MNYQQKSDGKMLSKPHLILLIAALNLSQSANGRPTNTHCGSIFQTFCGCFGWDNHNGIEAGPATADRKPESDGSTAAHEREHGHSGQQVYGQWRDQLKLQERSLQQLEHDLQRRRVELDEEQKQEQQRQVRYRSKEQELQRREQDIKQRELQSDQKHKQSLQDQQLLQRQKNEQVSELNDKRQQLDLEKRELERERFEFRHSQIQQEARIRNEELRLRQQYRQLKDEMQKLDEQRAQCSEGPLCVVKQPGVDDEVADEFLCNAMRFGLPGTHNLKLYNNFLVSYDCRLKHSVWVLQHLTASKKHAPQVADRAQSEFHPNETIPESLRPTNEDYKRSPYQRGHMCPARDCADDQASMDQSFCLSNICPQTRCLNRGPWQLLENYVDYLANCPVTRPVTHRPGTGKFRNH